MYPDFPISSTIISLLVQKQKESIYVFLQILPLLHRYVKKKQPLFLYEYIDKFFFSL